MAAMIIEDNTVNVAISMSDKEFRELSALVYEQFGIYLPAEKHTMVTVRLQKILKRLGLRSFSDYYRYLIADADGRAIVELGNHITTNHTFFYRESDHFDVLLTTVLPEIENALSAARNRDLRVWSAGCSSGEEPYMLAMLLMEYFGMRYGEWDAGVLATDISEKVLNIARHGVYADDRMEFLPSRYKSKYFRRKDEGEWEVVPTLKKEVLFRNFNLRMERFPFKKPFHIIFCRNVMIYFDQPTREALVGRLYDVLAPGGYLFIGHSETLNRIATPLHYVRPSLYKKL